MLVYADRLDFCRVLVRDTVVPAAKYVPGEAIEVLLVSTKSSLVGLVGSVETARESVEISRRSTTGKSIYLATEISR